MSLATRCPSCSTVFRVVADQLKLRGGLVRCGRCNQVFKGTDHLLDTEGGQSRFLPALSVPTSMVAPPIFVTPHHGQPAETSSSDEHPDDLNATPAWLMDTSSAADSIVANDTGHAQASHESAASPVVAPDTTQADIEIDTPEIIADFDAGFIDSGLPATEFSTTTSVVDTKAEDHTVIANPHAETPPSPLLPDEAPRIPTENESRPVLSEPAVHLDLTEPLFDLEAEESIETTEAILPVEQEAVEDLSVFVDPIFAAEPTLEAAANPSVTLDNDLDLALAADDLAEWSPPENVLEEVSQAEPVSAQFTYPQELALPAIHHETNADTDITTETQLSRSPSASSTDSFPSFAAVLKHAAAEDHSNADNARTEPFISSQVAVSEHAASSNDMFVSFNDDDASQKLREQLTQSAQQDYQAMAEPSFLAIPRQRGKWLSTLLGSGVVVTATLLIFQTIYIWRDQIASSVPELEVPLVQFCQYAGCQLDFPKNIEQLAVESSDLAPVPNQPHHYVLSGLLRSRANDTLALPVLELTLLDLQGQPVLRKILMPNEYLPDMSSEIEHGTIRVMQNKRSPRQSDNRHLGIAGSSEIKLNTVFESTAENAVGYRAYIFYP